MKKLIPSVKAILCGTGTEERKLKEMAEKYGLEKNITFVGKKQHTEVLATDAAVKNFFASFFL